MIRYIYISLLFLLVLCMPSCYDNFSEDPSHRLEFSVDTLSFDTVFSSIGSATAQVMIYNHNNKPLNIHQVALQKGSNSSFRINVDGMANAENSMRDVEIGANDSLFMFVEVTVDPTQKNSPVFVDDQVLFRVNDNVQILQLEAYGQDVEILRQKYILNDTTLNGDKPYLVYDYLAIDTAKTLTLDAGCTLYFHDRAQLVVYGHLNVKGTFEKPVVARGDRLDYMLADVPYNSVSGQWDGIYLLYENGVHNLNYFQINSGYNGLYLSNTNIDKRPSLKMNNSRIHNFTFYGLVAQNADVEVVNSEISNCGIYCAYLSGGEHTFLHTTIANYYNYPSTKLHPTVREDKPAVCINDIPKVKAPMTSEFRNCIIAGSRTNEIGLYTVFPERYNGVFEHNLIQSDSTRHFPQFKNNKWIGNSTQYTAEGELPVLFKNIRYEADSEWAYYDFTLDSASVAADIADMQYAEKYPLDRNNNNRLQDTKPDAGAYEYVE